MELEAGMHVLRLPTYSTDRSNEYGQFHKNKVLYALDILKRSSVPVSGCLVNGEVLHLLEFNNI